MTNRTGIWAALFDFDGVIVDSSAHHERSWEVLALREGLTLPEGHFRQSFGKRNIEIIPAILGWGDDAVDVQRLADAKEREYRDLVSRDGIRPLPGVVEWLERLRTADIPCALATSTSRENVRCILALTGLEGCFSVVVTAEDVERGKPDPEVFLLAASQMGYSPGRAVVFEDTPMGIEAAQAGGMRAVAVLGTHPRESFPAVDLAVERLDELTVDRVAGWFAEC